MRNRVTSNSTESYRIIVGSGADQAIQKSDGRLYHRGHVFGRATEADGHVVTIGLSSASKIWSNASSRLPELIAWCVKLARRINSDHVPITNSGLDHLSPGEEATSLPTGVISADWQADSYKNPPLVSYLNEAGQEVRELLLDVGIVVDRERSTNEAVALHFFSGSGLNYRATFSFETNRFFEPATTTEQDIVVHHGFGDMSFIDFLNEEMLQFYTEDLSVLSGYSLFPAPAEGLSPFDGNRIETVDWAAANVDIRLEFGPPRQGKRSIQEYLKGVLAASDVDVAYCDHGSGEIADFVTVKVNNGRVRVSLYHCKGAGGAQSGERVDDLYDVCSQATKSVIWAHPQRLFNSIKRRFNARVGFTPF